jgi:prolyl oligopeptidase
MRMKTLGFRIAVLFAACLGLVSYVAGSGASSTTRADGGLGYPETSKIPVADTLHGTVIVDDYRWLEDGTDPRVVDWTAAQEALTHSILDPLPQRDYLIGRFNELWRYDDETVPREVIAGERIFYMAKKKEDEKWTYNTKATQAADPVVLLNPNEWDLRVTLHGVAPSRDGTYLAFGQAHGGDENPVVRVMEVATGRILPDSLTGRRQYVAAWLPDNSGFYYTANPAAGTVPEGDEYYWHAVYLHKLGAPAEEDEKVFFDETVKEHFHGVQISEDGRYEIFVRSMFNKNEVYFKPLGSPEPLIPIATGFDAEYGAVFVDDRLLIRTDADAPLYKVYITEIAHPERENWREFIPENDLLKLSYVKSITGHIYVGYEENAYSQVKIYDLDGRHLRDFPFPTIGSASIGSSRSRWMSAATLQSRCGTSRRMAPGCRCFWCTARISSATGVIPCS